MEGKIDLKKEAEKIKLSREDEAKALVVWAFRNNPTLEQIHAGEEADIPDNVSRIKENEMKKIMKFAVDEMNFHLWLKEKRNPVYKVLIKIGTGYTKDWDKPRNPWKMYQEMLKKSGEDIHK